MRVQRLWWQGRGPWWAGAIGLAGLLLWQVLHWYGQVTWRWHTQLAGMRLALPVTGTLRFASTPLGGLLLHGRQVQTRYGRVEFQWRVAEGQLHMRCAPCRIDTPVVSERPLDLADLQLSLKRSGDQLWGQIESGTVHAHWWAVLGENQVTLAGALPDTPLSAVYALFATAIPEIAQVKIHGDVAVQVRRQLPAGVWHLDARTQGLQVAGLGTERLRGTASSILRPTPAADMTDASHQGRGDTKPGAGSGRHYLRCAVIAAEDQNFFEHAGYDTQAITASLTANVDHGGILLGASTLTQPLAWSLRPSCGNNWRV